MKDTKSSKSPLAAAMSGDSSDLKSRDKDTALDAAVRKITSMSRTGALTKERVLETGQSLLQTAEMQGANALASTARGYFGSEKLTYGGVDARAIGASI